MTKNTMTALINYLTANDIPELADAKAELLKEAEKNAEKAATNRAIYEAAHEVFVTVLSDEPRTIAELFNMTNEWPKTFSKSKLQYAVREYWAGEVRKIENGKAAYKYAKA